MIRNGRLPLDGVRPVEIGRYSAMPAKILAIREFSGQAAANYYFLIFQHTYRLFGVAKIR
jgi:hypothetical protein